MLRRILKYFLISLATGLGVVALILVLLHTSWLRSILQDLILNQVNSSIVGEVRTGVWEGSLFSELEIKNVSLSVEGKEAIAIPSLRIDYDIAGLLERRISIQNIEIDSVVVHLSREDGSTWNIDRAVTAKRVADIPLGENGPFEWRIVVDTLRIRNLYAGVISGEQSTSIENFSFSGSGFYCAESLSVVAAEMSFEISEPRIEVRECAVIFTMNSSRLALNNLVLKTRENMVTGGGQYYLNDDSMVFDLATGPFRPGEFRTLIGDLTEMGNPTIRVNGSFGGGELRSSLDLRDGKRGINADLRLDTRADVLAYSVTGSLREFEIEHLIGGDLIVSPLNGDFSIDGRGFTLGEMIAHTTVNLRDLRINEIDLGSVDAVAMLDGERASAQVQSVGPFGSMLFQGHFTDLTRSLAFAIDGTVNDLNIYPVSAIKTDITGTLSLNGVLSGPEGAAFSLAARADSAMVDTVLVDRFTCAGEFAEGEIRVDSVVIHHAGVMAVVEGRADTSGMFDAGFMFRVDDLSSLNRFLEGDSLEGNALVRGSISGGLNGFATDVSMNGGDLSFNGKSIGTLSGRTNATVTLDSTITVIADSLVLAWNELEWKNEATLTVSIFPDGFDLGSLTLVSGEQTIMFAGSIHTKRYSDLSVAVARFDMSQVMVFLLDSSATGVLDLNARLQGTVDHPAVESSLLFEHGVYNGIELPRVQFRSNILDSMLTWDIDLETGGGTLKGEGILPIEFPGANGLGFTARDQPFRTSLKTEQFDLSLLKLLQSSPVLVTGLLNGNVVLSGTVRSPDVEGFIRIDSGTVSHPGLGINYTGMRVHLAGNKEALILEEFSLANGAVTGSGSVGFRYVDSLAIEPDLVFKARNFDALAGPTHFATINGDVRVDDDDKGNIRFDGEIVLNRSRFFLPALQNIQTTRDLDPPLLLVAAGRVDTSSLASPDSAKTGPRLPSFKGKLTLKIPRATWLRGPRMNVELSGNIEIFAEAEATVIRGFLIVEQGSYEFYGRKFVFTQGRIDFDGGKEMDPSIYFEVEYPFRTEGVENTLMIVARGRAESPKIEFFFNKDAISESDAISYIIFGRKVDELSYGQKSAVADIGDALAKDLAANMINTQLSSMVGSTLGLDVVRVSGEDNWNKAVLTAGKYVTDDLFVAYERGISQSGSSSVVFESAKMEYYLMKFLYLHLIEATDKTSGVDVFLKFD